MKSIGFIGVTDNSRATAKRCFCLTRSREAAMKTKAKKMAACLAALRQFTPPIGRRESPVTHGLPWAFCASREGNYAHAKARRRKTKAIKNGGMSLPLTHWMPYSLSFRCRVRRLILSLMAACERLPPHSARAWMIRFFSLALMSSGSAVVVVAGASP